MSDNNHSKLKRKIAIYTLIFVLAGAAARIAYVNITAEKPIIEYYSENEWAGLNGSYIRSWEENTEGYSVKIVGYEVMEKEKYFSKYDLSGKDQSVADPFAYIMEVTIKIKNEENETAVCGVDRNHAAHSLLRQHLFCRRKGHRHYG